MKKILPIVVATLFLTSLVEFSGSAKTDSDIIEETHISEPIEIEETVVVEEPIFEEPEPTIEEIIDEELSKLDEFKEDKQTYLIKYMEVVNEYSEYYGAPLTVADVYTSEEIDMMCRCIMTEIGGGTFDAKVNVAQVILNRVDSDRFPNDPISVITAANQFAYGKTSYDVSILQALEYAYMFGSEEVNDAYYFQSMGYMEEWNGRDFKHHDGFHWFF